MPSPGCLSHSEDQVTDHEHVYERQERDGLNARKEPCRQDALVCKVCGEVDPKNSWMVIYGTSPKRKAVYR